MNSSSSDRSPKWLASVLLAASTARLMARENRYEAHTGKRRGPISCAMAEAPLSCAAGTEHSAKNSRKSVARTKNSPLPTESQPMSALPASANNSLSDRMRSEEHTSELQSQSNLVCRLLLEKKK